MSRKLTEKQLANLIPTNMRSKEEVRKNARNGGIKSGETRRRQRDKKEIISMLFDLKVDEKNKSLEKIKLLFPDLKVETLEELMDVKIALNVINKGDVNSYRELNDRRYGKSKQIIEDTRPDNTLEELKKLNEKFTK